MSLFQNYPFNHSSIPNLITAFGQLFEGMRLIKKDAAGNVGQVIEVPLEWAPKNKWISTLREDPEKLNNVEITLPRMSYEITQYRYDASRKVGARGTNVPVYNSDGTRSKIFNPVPYDIYIELSSLCKTQTDALMIIEQILPYFAPSLTIKIMILPELNLMKDIPILLSSVTQTDSYDGNPNDYRLIETTFQFVAQMDLFGPMPTGKEIKQAIVDYSTDEHFPDPQTKPQFSYKATVNPFQAEKTDPHKIDDVYLGGS